MNDKTCNCGNAADACRYKTIEHMMDMLVFTLSDLGVTDLEGASDIELLEITDRKIRMLYQICIASGMNEDLLRVAMRG